MTQTTIKTSSVNMDERKRLNLASGMTVRVWQKIEEKGKIRLQAYEGLVIAVKHGNDAGGTFTVRKVASGVGMEKIFPLYSPNIDKIEIVKHSTARRAKLYYIRDKAAREVRRRIKQLSEEVMAKIKGEAEQVKKDDEEAREKAEALAKEVEAKIEAEKEAEITPAKTENVEVASEEKPEAKPEGSPEETKTADA